MQIYKWYCLTKYQRTCEIFNSLFVRRKIATALLNRNFTIADRHRKYTSTVLHQYRKHFDVVCRRCAMQRGPKKKQYEKTRRLKSQEIAGA